MINTISLPHNLSKNDKVLILDMMKNQNNVIRFMYNRLKDNPDLTQKQLTRLSNSMHNIFVDSWFKQSAIYKAQDLIVKDEKIIFGGKKLFIQRCQKKINKEEFQIKKLLPIYLIGESSKHGNRKIEIEDNKIIFKPKFKTRIEIQFPKLRKNYRRIFNKLKELSEQCKISITFQIDLENFYLSYDVNDLYQKVSDIKIKNRIMSIDMNPNFLGYSIIDLKDKDTKSIIKTGTISIKELNDEHFKVKKSSDNPLNIYYTNKRHHEIFEMSKRLVNIANYYQIESFGIEDLKMKSYDKGNGRKYNRLVNNVWNRGKLVSNLQKRLELNNIKVYKVLPQYSSFIGNFLNREYFDPVAASIEISRRVYCFSNHIKPVVFPDFEKSIKIIKISLEELLGNCNLVDGVDNWKDFYNRVKNSKLRYRIPLSENSKSFRLFHKNSMLYEFI